MEYCYLESYIYRNSQYALCELLGEVFPASRRIAELERLLNSHYQHIPYSEERLALFVMASLGLDLADVRFQLVFAEGDRRELAWIVERFARSRCNEARQYIGVRIVAALLGVTESSKNVPKQASMGQGGLLLSIASGANPSLPFTLVN